MKRFTLLSISVVLALLAGGYILLCILADTEHMLPRTSINDTVLSGMTFEEALDILEVASERQRKDLGLHVAFRGESHKIVVGEALEYDYEPVAKEAIEKSQGRFCARGLSLLKAVILGNHIEYIPVIKDVEGLEKAIIKSGILDAGTTIQTSYKIEGDQLIFTIGTAGEDVDKDALLEKICTAIEAGDYENVIACPDRPGEVKAVDLDKVYEEVHIEAANATLDPQNGYAIVEAVAGVGFDIETAQAALDGAEEGSTVAIDLVYTEPEVSAQDLAAHLFTDELASYTTKVSGTANRLANVALAVEKCNGSILISGDVFSFNNTVGEQTEETGFKTANAILDGQIVQAYGGGICQVSSTIFAAALYADLGIVERWNHDYVSGYIPAGVDAAVAWDALDLKIANDKSYPIRLDVTYTGDDLTVRIIGTKTQEVPVEIETRIVESPMPGMLAMETYRKVYNEDKSQVFIEKVADSSYIN